MAGPETPDEATPAASSFRPWQVGSVILGLVLLGGILFAVTRDDGSSSGDPDGSSTSESTVSTLEPDPVTNDESDPLPTAPGGEPVLACTENALVAATPSVALAAGSVVTEFACSPLAGGDSAVGFAWVKYEAPDTDPLHVFFRTEAGEAGADGSVPGEWLVLSYGSDVFCGDEIPVEVCAESLPGAPVG